MEDIDELPGEPWGYGLDASGRPIILAQDGDQTCGHEKDVYLLRINADGQLESLP